MINVSSTEVQAWEVLGSLGSIIGSSRRSCLANGHHGEFQCRIPSFLSACAGTCLRSKDRQAADRKEQPKMRSAPIELPKARASGSDLHS
jgi:hypothetical protein